MPTIAQLRERPDALQVFLTQIQLINGPLVYWAPENIEVDGHQYEDYINNIQGISSELSFMDTAANNLAITISFDNTRPWRSYPRLSEALEAYPIAGAPITLLETYLDDLGVPASDGPVILTKGFMEQQGKVKTESFDCKVSSRLYHIDQTYHQPIINTNTYLNAFEDVGSAEPIIIGTGIQGPALRVDWGVRSTLLWAINETQITDIIITKTQNALPATGSVLIDDEEIYYTGTTLDARGNWILGGVARQYNNSAASSHRHGAEVQEVKSKYDSLLACHQLGAVTEAFAEINSRLYSVSDGLSVVWENGKQLLRATKMVNIKVTDADYALDVGAIPPVTMLIRPNNAWPSGTCSGNSADGNDGTWDRPMLSNPANYGFPATPHGKILSQTFNFRINTISTLKFAVNCGGYNGEIGPVVNNTGFVNYTFTIQGGNWDDPCSIHLSWGTSDWYLIDVWKVVSYIPGTVTLTGGPIATHGVQRFHAACNGFASTAHDYGTIGSTIERPDYVIKQFLVNLFGIPLADINTPSFDAAGAKYAAAIPGGYKFGFRQTDALVPTSFMQQLAFECRSTLQDIGGQFYLTYIDDTPPTATKTIDQAETDKDSWEFSKTVLTDLCNQLTANFGKNYSKMGSESDWTGSSLKSDTNSIHHYSDTRTPYPKTIDLSFVRSQTYADHLVLHLLLRWKSLLNIATGNVFWEHFNLLPGQTILLTGQLYDGLKYQITAISRNDGSMQVVAQQWWIANMFSGAVEFILSVDGEVLQHYKATGAVEFSIDLGSDTLQHYNAMHGDGSFEILVGGASYMAKDGWGGKWGAPWGANFFDHGAVEFVMEVGGTVTISAGWGNQWGARWGDG